MQTRSSVLFTNLLEPFDVLEYTLKLYFRYLRFTEKNFYMMSVKITQYYDANRYINQGWS
jgi:hypothetical protein